MNNKPEYLENVGPDYKKEYHHLLNKCIELIDENNKLTDIISILSELLPQKRVEEEMNK